MEFDDDNHLCLRCGKIIVGLENYVSHRQQQCYKYHQPTNSPLLSDTSSHLPSTESQAEDLNSLSPQDICKLSTNDFFLSLNLQSNYKSDNSYSVSCDSQKNLSNVTENFCPRLVIPALDGDLVHSFVDDKGEMCHDVIVDENESISMEGMVLSVEKWDSNFKLQNNECPSAQNSKPEPDENFSSGSNAASQMDSEFEMNSLSTQSCPLKENIPNDMLITKKNVNKTFTKNTALKKYQYSKSSSSSLRQKLYMNCKSASCDETINFFRCNLCNIKYDFCVSFLDHILTCNKKHNDIEKWKSEVFKNELFLVHFAQFRCQLCSFYCNDRSAFHSHMTTANHCQNAAGLKNPLICFPCQEECCTSDEIVVHFIKNHFQNKIVSHPVIVSEKKKNLHCCFCFSLVQSISNLELNINSFNKLNYDIASIKNSLFVLLLCGYGINKYVLNLHLKILKPLINSYDNESEQTEILISDSVLQHNDKNNSEKYAPDFSQNNFKKKRKASAMKEKDIYDVPVSKSIRKNKNFISKFCNRKLHVAKRIVMEKLLKTGENIKKFSTFRWKESPSSKKYSCLHCDKCYFSKMALNRHVKAHHDTNSKTKPSSTDGTSDISHIKSVSNNVYLCDKCGYTGKTAHQLTKHERSHSGERPFKCKDCNYSSSRSSQLSRHKRLHTGSKPYKCPYCSYTCNTQENLRKHILKTKKHKGKKMYPCQYCDFDCNMFSDYRDHLLNFHSEQFPNGDKDITSSSIAGIYDKSFNCK